MRHVSRWTVTAILAAAATSPAARPSRADEPAKAAPLAPLTLRFDPATTYLYRFTEQVICKIDTEFERPAELPADAELPSIEIRSEVTWDVGLKLAETRPDGSLVVSLMTTRLRTRSEMTGQDPVSFDSDEPGAKAAHRNVGRTIRVTLSPAARVLDVSGPDDPIVKDLPAEVRAIVDRIHPDTGMPFAQRFFRELPADAPRKSMSWEAKRALTAEQVRTESQGVPSLHVFGEVVEKATVSKAGPALLVASIVSRGKLPVERRDVPDPKADLLSDLASARPQMEEWLVTGDVTVRHATGLVERRTSKATIAAHRNPMKLPKDVGNRGFGAANVDLPDATSPLDETYEVTTRLEALESR